MWLSFKTYSMCILDELDKRVTGQKEEVEILQWQVVQRCCNWISYRKNIAEYINRVNLFHWFEEMICSTEKVKDSLNKPISHQQTGKQADIAIIRWSCTHSL